jgi:hypothetical protein
MDLVIQSLKEINETYRELPITNPFYEFVWSRLMEPYFKKKHSRTHRLEPPHEGYCLRVRQDYYSADIHGWKDFYVHWYEPPIPYALYAHKMWIEDEIMKLNTRRMTFLMGASYKSGSVLAKPTKHGWDHASIIRKNIALKAGL